MALRWEDPPDIADRCELPEAAEDARAARWTAFVEWCKGDRPKSPSEWSTMLFHIQNNMQGRGDWYHTAINAVILDFAQEFGWSSVMVALGRAMREQDEARPVMAKAELR